MRTLILFLLFISGIFKSFGQSSHTENYTPANFDGTYQIEIHNVRYQPYIPGNILEIVENSRRDHEVTYYPLDENMRIRILSRDEINNNNFQKLEFIKYF
jgi:hypothetical protein